MDMEVILLKRFRLYAIFLTDGTNIAHGDNGRFLHYVTHLTGEINVSFSRHHVDFNLQRFSAHTGPCKSPDYAHLRLFCSLVKAVLFLSQIFFKIGSCDTDLFTIIITVFPLF